MRSLHVQVYDVRREDVSKYQGRRYVASFALGNATSRPVKFVANGVLSNLGVYLSPDAKCTKVCPFFQLFAGYRTQYRQSHSDENPEKN